MADNERVRPNGTDSELSTDQGSSSVEVYVHEMTPEERQQALSRELATLFREVRAELPHLNQQEAGRIALGLACELIATARTHPWSEALAADITSRWLARGRATVGASPGTASSVPSRPGLARPRFEGLLRHLSEAKEGTRNDRLHWVSCRAGEMLANGELRDPVLTADLLTDVAHAIGLDPREVRGTIRSGFSKSGVAL
jgi:hypothetical protein